MKTVMTETSSTIQKIEQWEEAWANYISALEIWESDISGEARVHWCGVAGRRLNEAKRRMRQLDPDFCKTLQI